MRSGRQIGSSQLNDQPDDKPRMRGRLHQVAFFVSIPAGIALVLAAPSALARLSALVFALALAALFGTSAAYHRVPWSPRALRRMKRLDHSMIFVLIAGTYTPFALLVLHGAWSVAMLSVVWGVAALGIVLKMVRIDGWHALAGALYIALGWAAIIALPQLVRGLSGPAIGLTLGGGALYTVGAVVLASHRPDPRPATFGYHEVWHSFTIGGSLCHYLVILLVVRAVA